MGRLHFLRLVDKWQYLHNYLTLNNASDVFWNASEHS